MADAVAFRLQMAQVGLKGSLGQVLLRVKRAAVASALRNPIQEVPQFPLIRVHRVASFAAQRYNELFKERGRGFHFCTALFPIRVFGPHLVVYTRAAGDLPIEFVTESVFCDELSGMSHSVTDLVRPRPPTTGAAQQMLLIDIK